MYAWEEIQKTVDYIEENLNKSLTIEELAKISHLSPYYFQRLFSRLVGKTVNEYVKARRVAKAKELLKNSNQRILDIALDVGFQSHASLTRAFKEVYKITPATYRKSNISLIDFSKPELSMKYMIAQVGLTKVGVPFTWGATGPGTFDCSGLTYWAYNQVGIKINRTTAAGYSQYGKAISANEAQIGDIVTFREHDSVSHIGIIIDDQGNMVHASGKANETNGEWGGQVRVNNIYEIGLPVYNFRRIYE